MTGLIYEGITSFYQADGWSTMYMNINQRRVLKL